MKWNEKSRMEWKGHLLLLLCKMLLTRRYWWCGGGGGLLLLVCLIMRDWFVQVINFLCDVIVNEHQHSIFFKYPFLKYTHTHTMRHTQWSFFSTDSQPKKKNWLSYWSFNLNRHEHLFNFIGECATTFSHNNRKYI